MIVNSWHDLPDEPFLTRGGCQLWLAWLDEEDPSGYRSLLSQDETLRARRLRSPLLADRFTVGRGILRILLGRYFSADPQDVIFSYGPHGRPEVASGTQAGFSFNLSHSDGLAVFAIARGVQVGVDVEAFHPLEDLDASASIFLSAGELEEFKALPSHQKPERFFTLWTSREAYLKALGHGFALKTEISTPEFPPTGPDRGEQLKSSGKVGLSLFNPAPGYHGALACL